MSISRLPYVTVKSFGYNVHTNLEVKGERNMGYELVNSQWILQLNALFTLALAGVLLIFGFKLKQKVPLLSRYCIPAPVIGGFAFMLLTFAGHQTGAFAVHFENPFQDVFMLMFFTTVGLGASYKLLKTGGILLVIYWLICGAVSICQNVIGIGLAKVLNIPAPYALLSSAISMIGGHGAALSYGKTFAQMGYQQGPLVGAAAATFGLISAVLIGGPLGRRLIEKHGLTPPPEERFDRSVEQINSAKGPLSAYDIIINVVVILCCMAVGTLISGWISNLIHMGFPTYVGAMFTAVVVRNLNDKMGFYRFSFSLTDGLGDVMLNLYLSLAMMTLKLWELSGLLGGILVVVCTQVLFMGLIAYFVVFRLLGSTYDAAVMCAGLCGHGLGATPSAIVNMTAVNERYGMSRKAMMIVPIVGAFLVDLIYQPQTIAFINFFVGTVKP